MQLLIEPLKSKHVRYLDRFQWSKEPSKTRIVTPYSLFLVLLLEHDRSSQYELKKLRS